MKILITGGGGYIGSHVLKALDALIKIGKFKFVKANLEDDLSGIFVERKFSSPPHFRLASAAAVFKFYAGFGA